MTDEEKIYAMAYTEILEVLKFADKDLIAKIPEDIMNFFKTNRDVNYEFHLDSDKPLEEQELLAETKALIVFISTEYWASPEELEEIYREAELELKEHRLEQYNQMLDDDEE